MKFLYFLLVLNITACGQNNPMNSRSNKPGENHKEVPGTKVSMVPPAGFSPASSFNGFQQEKSRSSIIVIEMPGPYEEVTKAFTQEGLKTQGLILIKKEDVLISGYNGVFIEAEQSAYGIQFSKYILAFGTDTNTVIINGVCPKDLGSQINSDIKNSLLSIVYEPNKVFNPLEGVLFELNVSDSKLKFAQVISNSIIYTVDGKAPTESDDKTTMIVANSMGEVEIDNKKEYAIDRLREFGNINDIQADEIKDITIDNISGYEISSYAVNASTNEKELVYEVMLFDKNIYYLIIGTTQNEFEHNLDLFKKAAQTFKRK